MLDVFGHVTTLREQSKNSCAKFVPWNGTKRMEADAGIRVNY